MNAAIEAAARALLCREQSDSLSWEEWASEIQNEHIEIARVAVIAFLRNCETDEHNRINVHGVATELEGK